jgi:hypothetical protein
MGRRDAVQVIVEVVNKMRLLDPRLIVTYEPGWEKRGNGTTANYEGGIWHHTASPSSPTRPFPTQTLLRVGRSDLPGPLCNFAGPWCSVDRPTIHVMAAHPANHAGASGGRSMGPLPKTNLFNPRVLGLEIDYAGLTAMSPGQLHVAQLWARAVADVVGGGDINRVRGHMETSVTGKWDPGYANGKTYDLNALRASSARLTPGDDMPLSQQDANLIADTIVNRGIGRMPDNTSMEIWEALRDAPIYARQAALAAEATKAAVAQVQKALQDAPKASAPVAVDAAAVAASLAQNPQFLASMAKAVNDDAAARMAS